MPTLERGAQLTPFEYLLVLASVVSGLAISDLAISLHRLLNAGERVRWGLFSPLAAIIAFLKIISQWWIWYHADAVARQLTFEMFVGVMAGAVLLFLIAATALPELGGEEQKVDLPAYYQRTKKRFWLLFTTHWLIVLGVSAWAALAIGSPLPLTPVVVIAPIVALVLAFTRFPWLHAIGLLGFIAFYLIQFLGQHL